MKQKNIIQKNELNSGNFFYPRIIREFEDKDEPMLWGGELDGKKCNSRSTCRKTRC